MRHERLDNSFVSDDYHDLFHQSLIFFKNDFKLNKCIIMLLTFFCNRSSWLLNVSRVDQRFELQSSWFCVETNHFSDMTLKRSRLYSRFSYRFEFQNKLLEFRNRYLIILLFKQIELCREIYVYERFKLVRVCDLFLHYSIISQKDFCMTIHLKFDFFVRERWSYVCHDDALIFKLLFRDSSKSR